MLDTERNPYDPPGRFRVGRIVFYALSGLLIVLLIALLFSVVIMRKKGEQPSVFGFSVYIVATDSMEPAISPGSALLVRRTDPGTLQVDDVITFEDGYDQDGQMLINTHRIVEIVDSGGERAFRTKGDKSTVPDETLRHPDQILGKAVSYMPGIGRFFAFVKTPLGLVCCIAVPLLILLVFEIINLIRLSRKSKDEELLEEEVSAQQGPLALAVNRRRQLFAPETVETTEPPAQAPFSFATPVQTGPELPPEEPAAEDMASEYGFTVPAERENVPLETPGEKLDGVAYERTEPVPPSPANITQEFALPAAPPPTTVPPVSAAPSAPVSTPPPSSVFTAPSEKTAPAPAETDDPAFKADVAGEGRDRFKIDGIDVRVKPDSINLALEGDREERDISITVTEEYTNVTVGTKGHEVNFALFRDEKGQKVIIQKKAR